MAHDSTPTERRIWRTDVGGHAWKATFHVHGKRYDRYFADSLHGGPEASKKAAVSWVSQVEAYGEMLALMRRFKARKNTRSGVPGVSRVNAKPGRGAFWVGYWADPKTGKRHSKKFAVSLHGEDAAKSMAVAYRERAMTDLMARYNALVESSKEIVSSGDLSSLLQEGSRTLDSVSSGRSLD